MKIMCEYNFSESGRHAGAIDGGWVGRMDARGRVLRAYTRFFLSVAHSFTHRHDF